mmetsp:Transcript_23789/g.56006  ORF Transcript_23789/g.56006 Transcript_23789/m.56006 type:complete len:1115 (+) Transcript_23789:129-3473(+)
MADDNSDDDNELYDEFGNYIGPELDSSDDEDEDDDSSDEEGDDENDNNKDEDSVVSGMNDDDENENKQQNRALIPADESLEGTADPANAIVLHEDKEHYASAEDTFGEGVRTAVLDEDAMDLDQPIVEPVVTKSHHVAGLDDEDGDGGDGNSTENRTKSKQTVSYLYSDEFLTSHLLSNETTSTRRGIALVGHLHHGKTSLIDTLMEPTLQPSDRWDPLDSSSEDPTENKTNNSGINSNGGSASCSKTGTLRYTDITKSERERQMSLQSCPITLALPDTRGKSYALTIVDCPGHVQFHDESVAALRALDGAVLCVDAAEGILLHTELLIRQIVGEGLPICLVVTKLDRLVTELRLPPRDAYFKLLNVVESANKLVREASHGRYPELSPSRGNVAFSSALHGWLFTLQSMAEVYLEHSRDESLGSNVTPAQFAKRLWGDWWFDDESRTFVDDPSQSSSQQRSFVTFCLEPIYKIYAACLGESEKDVEATLKPLGVHLTKTQLRSSARPLLRIALSRFLETASCGFVDMVVKHVPPPSAAAKGKVARCYSGPLDAPFVRDMLRCESRTAEKLVMHVTKLYSSSDGRSFDALARIYCGTCRPGQKVRVLGEGFVPDEDDEDTAVATIESIAIPRGRSRTKVTLATAGNWVLLTGVDATIAKTATIVGKNSSRSTDGDEDEDDVDDDEDDDSNPVHIFSPLRFPFVGGESTMKMALEPLNPAELPKMVQGLRSVSKAYPMVRTRVEESGEHVLFGTGELYMDCVLHDLRHVYGDVEVKVADPSVALRETVVDTSSLKCFAETTNKKNKLTFIAEPMDDGLAEKLESGTVKLGEWDQRKVGRFFQSQYGWDLLSSRSVWAFGDSPTRGTNLLLDDTLPSEVDKSLLNSCRSSIVQGFQWATREGPLCEEPVRGAKLKVLEVTLADKAIYRGGGQVIPTARRTVHSSLLTATPRLMEPIYKVQIQCPGDMVAAIQPVLKRRRGHIVQDRPISGTLLYNVRGFIPLLDSFGFETDLRTYTQGQAMVHSVFDHWAIVPGDPLDKNILLHPLEPSPPHVLARELLLKTRRRKGLSEDVSIDKFFDAAMKEQMAASQAEGSGRMMVEEMEDGEEIVDHEERPLR